MLCEHVGLVILIGEIKFPFSSALCDVVVQLQCFNLTADKDTTMNMKVK